jgi:hypothetical protein
LPQFTTMYDRVLGVKILIFGTLLLLGVASRDPDDLVGA